MRTNRSARTTRAQNHLPQMMSTPSNGGSGGGGSTQANFVAEDGTTFYVAEDGTTFYVTEN